MDWIGDVVSVLIDAGFGQDIILTSVVGVVGYRAWVYMQGQEAREQKHIAGLVKSNAEQELRLKRHREEIESLKAREEDCQQRLAKLEKFMVEAQKIIGGGNGVA